MDPFSGATCSLASEGFPRERIITSRTIELVEARTRGDRGVTTRNSLEADNGLTGAGAASFIEGKSIFPSAATLRLFVV